MIIVLALACMMSIIVGILIWFFTRPKEGDACTIEEYDPNGTYAINAKGECTLQTCNTGYTKIGSICEPVSAGPAPSGASDAFSASSVYQADGIPDGRFIQIIHTIANDETDTENPNKTIKLAEVEVYGAVAGINLARGKTVTGSSSSEDHGFMNLTDGSLETFAATVGEDALEMDNFKIDLGHSEPIHKISLIGEAEGSLYGLKVNIMDEIGNIIRTTEPIASNDSLLTYVFTYTVPKWE